MSDTDPFAPTAEFLPAPSFPEDRLRRAGMTDAEVATSLGEWNSLTPDEQTEALESLTHLTDDEIAASVLESRETPGEDEGGDGAGKAPQGQEDEQGAHSGDGDGGPQALVGDGHEQGGEPAWATPEADGGPTEAERQAYYEQRVADGLSDPEAREEAWPGGEDAHPQVPPAQVVPVGEADEQVAPGGPGEAVEAPAGDEPSGADPSLPLLTPTPDEVPDGTVAEVLEWVGEDAERAQAALDVEYARGEDARVTLTDPLERLTGG